MADSPGVVGHLNSTVRGQCANGVASTILALNLANIEGQVWVRRVGSTKNVTYPCIIISPLDPIYNAGDGPATRPDVTHRVGVALLRGGNREDAWTEDSAAMLGWGEEIFRAFAKTAKPFSLSGAIQTAGHMLLLTDCQMGVSPDLVQWLQSLDAELMEVHCKVRYPSTA